MDTKYKDVTLSNYAVSDYESSRDTFLSWADDMCKEAKQYLRLAFKGKHPGEAYEFDEPLEDYGYCRIRLVQEAPLRKKSEQKGKKSNERKKMHYVLEYENASRTHVLGTTELELFHAVLVALEQELPLLDGKDEPEHNLYDYEEWVIDLWNNARDLLQPFMAELEYSDLGSKQLDKYDKVFYTFSSPIIIDHIKYRRLSSISSDDDIDGYDAFYIESSDGQHKQYLEGENPYLCIKVIDKLIAESRKASATIDNVSEE